MRRWRLPTEENARLALRTQQVLAHETGVTNTADPVGGAYEIERMTDQIEDDARIYLDRIDALGGMVAAIEQGFVQREIQQSAYDLQKKVESGEQTIVGVNRFRVDDEPPIPTLQVDPEQEKQQVARVASHKNLRDGAKAGDSLRHLEDTANSTDNLMPAVLSAVASEATLGEIADSLRQVFGVYDERVVL